MAWLLCDIVGTGTEADPVRPAVSDYAVDWTEVVTLEQRARAVVQCEYQAAFDSDTRIRRLTKALLAQYVPDDGEEDGSDALALKAVRRALLENLLGADDFGDFDSLTVGDIPQAKRQRLTQKIDAAGLDRSQINTSTLIVDALRILLPQISARITPQAASQSGTFSDDFDGEVSDTDLAAHTPSGGTAWARQDGSANDIVVTAVGQISNNGNAHYLCDDQGSAEQYTQYTVVTGMTGSSFLISRYSNTSNYWAARVTPSLSRIELFTKIANTFTQRGALLSYSPTAGHRIRLEMTGNNGEVYLDTGSGFTSEIGPYNNSFNNTATRQGVGGSALSTGPVATYYEAGTLGGATTVSASLSSILLKQQLLSSTASGILQAQGLFESLDVGALLVSQGLSQAQIDSVLLALQSATISVGAVLSVEEQTFTTSQDWEVPAGWDSVEIKAWGAGGGGGTDSASGLGSAAGGSGGGGGFAQCSLAVTPLETLRIEVGAGGGGGTYVGSPGGPGGGGGGLTGAFRGAVSQANALIIAGAGGGGNCAISTTRDGGAGGGAEGEAGEDGGGTGGTQTAGGTGGGSAGAALTGGDGEDGDGTPHGGGGVGGSLNGGDGGDAGSSGAIAGGGGGGAGWYGGGGGGAGGSSGGGGGGGGSGFVGGSVTTLTAGSGAAVANSGDSDYLAGKGVGGAGGSSTANGVDGGDGYIVIRRTVDVPFKVASLSAILRKQQMATLSTSALLSQPQERAAAVNALLAAAQTRISSFNAILQQAQTTTTAFGAILKGEGILIQANAILQVARSLNANANAVLALHRTLVVAADALLVRAGALGVDLSSVLIKGQRVTTAFEAILRFGFWQADTGGDGNWKKSPEGSGLWASAAKNTTSWSKR